MKVVFVTSEGLGYNALMQDSSKSRANCYEVGDLTDEEAFNFIKFSSPCPTYVEENVKPITNCIEHYTGGRMKLLCGLKGAVGKQRSLEGAVKLKSTFMLPFKRLKHSYSFC